jgi:hypothetical protein
MRENFRVKTVDVGKKRLKKFSFFKRRTYKTSFLKFQVDGFPVKFCVEIILIFGQLN